MRTVSPPSPPRLTQKPRLRRAIQGSWELLTLPLLLFILIPIASLFFHLTPADLVTGLEQAQVRQAIQLSLTTSLATVVLSAALGTPLAYYLHRRASRLARLIDTLVDLPIVLPPAVAGVALLTAFGRQGLVGRAMSPLGVTLPFTTAAVIMAQTFVAAPLYVKSAALGFAGVDLELRRAAALDGANRWQVFQHVVVPLSWVSVLSGCLLTWARAMGEFGATIIFAGNFPGRTQTMPLAIYIGFEIDLRVALTLSIILVAFSFVVLALVRWVLNARLDR
ncbi:MAG: ABC transporter permease [Anaerolineales bacterium]